MPSGATAKRVFETLSQMWVQGELCKSDPPEKRIRLLIQLLGPHEGATVQALQKELNAIRNFHKKAPP